MEDSNSTLKKEEELILEVKGLNVWHTLMNPGLGKGFSKEDKQRWWASKDYKYKIGTIRSVDLDTIITIFTESFDMSKKQKRTPSPVTLEDSNIQKIIKDNGINLSGFEEETIKGSLDTAKTATEFEDLYIGWVEGDEKTKTIIKETMKTMFRFIFGKKTINDKNKLKQIYKRFRVAYTDFEPYEKVPCKKGSMTEHFRKCLAYRLKGVKMEISAARQIGYPEDNIFIQNLFTLEKGLLMMIKFLDSKSGCFEYSSEYDENDAYISDDENDDDDDFTRAINLALHIINEDSVDEKELLEIFRKPSPSGETVSKLIEQINNLLGLHAVDNKAKLKFAILVFCYTRAKRALELLRSQMDESGKLELQRIKANILEQLGKIEDDDIIADIIAGLGSEIPDTEKINTAITRIVDHLKNVKGAVTDADAAAKAAGDRVKALEASVRELGDNLIDAEQRARDAADAAAREVAAAREAERVAAEKEAQRLAAEAAAAAAREAQQLAAEAAAAATRRADEADEALRDEKEQRRSEGKEMEGIQAELAKVAAAAAAAEDEKNRALAAAAAATRRAEDTEEALRKAENAARVAEEGRDEERERAKEAERLARVAEGQRAAAAAEGQRAVKALAAAKRAAEEAEAKRAADAERARLEAEAEAGAKRAADAERARLEAEAEEAEAQRKADAEKKRLADEKAALNAAERARLEAEAEAQREADAERDRLAAEAERERLAADAAYRAQRDSDRMAGLAPEQVENLIGEEIKGNVGEKGAKIENIPLTDVVRNIIKDILKYFFYSFDKYDSKNKYYINRIDDNTDILGGSLTKKIVLANPMTVTDEKSKKEKVTELNLNKKEDFWQYVKGSSNTSYIFYKLNLDDSIKVLFIIFRRMIKEFLVNNSGFVLNDTFYKNESDTTAHINSFITTIFGFKNDSSRQAITKMYYLFLDKFKIYFENLIIDPKFLETKFEQLGGALISAKAHKESNAHKESKASRLCDLMLTSILLKLDGPEFNYQDLINKGGKVLDDIGQCELILEMLNNLVDEHCLIKKNDGYTFSSVYIEFEQARALVEAFNNHFTDKEKQKFYSISSGFFNYKVPDEHQTLLGKHPFFLIGRPSSEEVPLYGVIDEEITLTSEERAVLEEDAIPIGAIIFLYIVCFREYQGQDCLPRPVR